MGNVIISYYNYANSFDKQNIIRYTFGVDLYYKEKIMKFFSKRLAVLLLSIISVISFAGVLSGCKSCAGCKKSNPVVTENSATTRKAAPTDGTTPMEHTPADNVAYLAYVLDNQPFYHAYANNATRAFAGYEQVTRTWKDYKSAEASGEEFDVMVSSDLSYSTFIKSSTQACFINGNEALTRNGGKPGQNTDVTAVEWNGSSPSYYSKEDYQKILGLFSTELSVYVLNSSTIDAFDEVTDNGDGTYSVKLYLNASAGVWYQYAMKTNGSLTQVPEFKKIELTFTFDSEWRVISSYCEEKIRIKPRALGMEMDSNSKTTTTYDYTAEGINEGHFAYYENYYKQYVHEKPSTGEEEKHEPELLDVLSNGFGKVLSESGQQFTVDLTLGENSYEGKIFLKLADLSKVLESLDVRLALGKSGNYAQDLYAQFKDGAVDLYYSDGFAVTANITKVSESVKKLTEWFGQLSGGGDAPETPDNPSEEQPSEGTSLDVDSLLQALKFEYTDTLVTITLDSDDLLGLGVGIDAVMTFSRTIDEEGFSSYELIALELNSVTYKSDLIEISGRIAPDSGSQPITRNPAEAPFDIADFIGSVYELLDSPSYKVSIGLDGSAELEYINGLVLDATAYIKPENAFKKISASVDMEVSYAGLSALLNVYYTIAPQSGGYGDIYIHLKKINETDVSAKIYCDIKDLTETVKELLSSFNGKEVQTYSEISEDSANTVASLVNKIISLDFGTIIKELKASQDKLNLTLDIDEILGALGVDFGIALGEVSLELGKDEAGKATLGGRLPAMGAALGLGGSNEQITAPDSSQYVDLNSYLDAVVRLINSNSYKVDITLNGNESNLELLHNAYLNATAELALKNNFKELVAKISANVNYEGLEVELTAYYTIGFDNGNYGEVYLNVTKVGDIQVDAKVRCDIKEAADAVTRIIDKFKTPAPAAYAAGEATGGVSEIIGKLLEIDFASIIKQIKADNESVNAVINVDGLLAAFGVNIGEIEVGDLALELAKDEAGKATLGGKLPNFGLAFGLSGSESNVTLPDSSDYVDLNEYVNSLEKLINSNAYKVDVTLNGGESNLELLHNAYLDATAELALKNSFKELVAKISANVNYEGLEVELTAYYAIGFENGNYGEVYINVTKVGDIEIDAKVRCDIKEAADAVTKIIDKFKTPAPAAYAAGEATGGVSEIIGKLLEIDFASIIKQIKADNESVNAVVNVDGLLAAFGVNIGEIEVGDLSLELGKDEAGKATLGGKLPNFGLALGLSGSDSNVTLPDSSEYADIVEFIESINALLESEIYELKAQLNGADGVNEQLKNISASISVYAKLSADFKNIEVLADDITVKYADENLLTVCVKLSAYYTINLNDGNYGKAYLHIGEITFGEGENANKINNLDIKVYADISKAIDSVKEIVNAFKPQGNAATVSAPEQRSSVSQYIDYVSLIKSIKVSNSVIGVSLDVDGLLGMLGVSDKLGGLQFGSLALELAKCNTDGVNTAVLSGALDSLGLSVNFGASNKEITVPNHGDYASANDYIDGLKALINGENINSYFVNVAFSGTKLTIPATGEGNETVIDLSGVTVNAPARVKLSEGFKSAEVFLPLTVGYNKDNISLEVQLQAYYSLDFDALGNGSYGDIYLELVSVELNSQYTKFGAKVYCDIGELAESVKTLISLINGSSEGGESISAVAENAVSGVVEKIISLNFAAIIEQFTADGNSVNLNLNVDEILKNFIDTKGFEFGSLALSLKAEKTESSIALTADGKLEKLGLSLALGGSDYVVSAPADKHNYLNLNELAEIILAAYEQASAIIEAEELLFELDGTLTIDGISFGIDGEGEAVWQTKELTKEENGVSVAYTERSLLSVALKATLTVAEDGKKSSIALSLIYNGGAQDNAAPLVRLAIGTLVLDIYPEDIDGTKEGVQGLINSVESLLKMFGKGGSDEASVRAYAQQAQSGVSEQGESGLDIAALVNAVLTEINKFTFGLEGEGALKDIAVSHADGSLKLSANGGLAFDIKISDVLALKASVRAPEKTEAGFARGEYTATLFNSFDEVKDGKPVYTFYGSKQSGSFVKAVYEYLFDVIEQLSIKEILGSDTYRVHIELNGAESGIDALAGVSANGELYYTEGLVGTVKGTKLAEADINLNVNGTLIKLNARYAGLTLYLELKDIAGTQLFGADAVNGIRVKADVHDVYAVAELLVELVNKINFPESGTALAADGETQQGEQSGKADAVVAFISKILSLELDGIISREKIDGENVYTIKPDSILEAFNVNVSVGTVVVAVNPETHALKASVTANGKQAAWVSFSADVWKDENNEHNTLNPDSYIDIGFVKTLIADLGKTVLDEQGNINTVYSFAGNIEATLRYNYSGIPIKSDITFDNTVLTAGLDERGEFYLTLTASLRDNSVSASIIPLGNVTSKGNISITYSNGLITLGRDGNYRVMTLDYLLDNITAKDNTSPVKWLLGTSDLIWGVVSGQLGNIGSGLGKAETLQLYNIKQAASLDGGKFYLSSILNGYSVNADGIITGYGTDKKAASELGLTDNYYAFDINGNGLTGGTITSLYVALLRDDAGIKGFKASAGVMGMINAKINLGNRAEAHAENYYNTVSSEYTFDTGYTEKLGEHETKVFGCFETSSNTTYYSTRLDKVTLRLLGTDGNILTDENGNAAEYEVTYGSTVYLDSIWAPFWSDEEGYVLTYGDRDGNPLGGTPVYANDGTTVIGTYITLDDTRLDATDAPEYDENGNRIYHVTVRRIKDGVLRKAFIYHTGVKGVDDVTAALPVNEDGSVKILDYEISGYILIGTYRTFDAALGEYGGLVSAEEKNAFIGDEVYCLYLIDTYSADGVVYKLHATNNGCYNCENTAHYHISGYDANAILPYTADLNNGGSTLFMKNEIEINGVNYPVTAIDEKAFAYMGNSTEATDTTPGIGAGLKNVVVPENVKFVGKLAFTDNMNIKSVVFLAETVAFDGNRNDKNYPFYGCSVQPEGRYTNLCIYYNYATTVSGEGGISGDNNVPSWAHFRTFKDGLTTKYRYIGHNGGELGTELSGIERYEYSKNDGAERIYDANYKPMWAYVTFKLNGVNITNTVNIEDLKLCIPELKDGICKTALTVEGLQSLISSKLNGITSANGYINAFNVTADGAVEMNGKLYTVNITVEEKPAGEWFYSFGFGSTVPDCTANYAVTEGNLNIFNGVTYVRAGSEITLSSAPDASGIYALEYWELNGENLGNEITSVIMPEGAVTLKAFWDAPNGFSDVTVISEISFEYHGTVYQAGNATVKVANETVMSAPEAEGYDFLGWATSPDGTALSVETTVEITVDSTRTLYALWAVSKNGVTFTADSSATVSASGEGTVYKWYNGLEDGYTAETSNTLTVGNTVLKARMNYSLTINFNSGSTVWGYNYNAGGDNGLDVNYSNTGNWLRPNWQFTLGEQFGTNNCNYVITDVLEGYSVTVSRKWSNTLLVQVNDGKEFIASYIFKGFKEKSTDIRNIADAFDADNKHYIAFTAGNWTPSADVYEVEVDGMTGYHKSGSDQQFGTLANAKSNMSVFVKA